MARIGAFFLLIIGGLLLTIGLIGTVVTIVDFANGRVKPGLLFGFAVVDVIGLAMLIGGIRVFRRTKPIGSGWTHKHDSGVYLADLPDTRVMDGSPYTVLYTTPIPGKNGRPSSLKVTTPVDMAGEFQIVRETWFDRLGKRLGLAAEIQTGDEDFDKTCYVRSDTPVFAEAYLADPVKRVAILDMRRLGFPDVSLKNGEVSVTWIGFNATQHDRPELADDAAARIILLSRNLPKPQPEFEHHTGEQRRRSQWFLWVGLIIFALTFIAAIVYRPIRGSDLFQRTLLIAAIAWPAFVFTAGLLLRGTSTSHYAWGWLVFASLFMFPLGCAGTIALLNATLDESPAVTHHAKIVEKYTTKSKNSTNYHVRCASWREPGETESFSVTRNEYGTIMVNQSDMVVTARAGRFGLEWLVSKQVDVAGKAKKR